MWNRYQRGGDTPGLAFVVGKPVRDHPGTWLSPPSVSQNERKYATRRRE